MKIARRDLLKREAQEELADIRAYDAARPKILAELAGGDFLTLVDYRNGLVLRKRR